VADAVAAGIKSFDKRSERSKMMLDRPDTIWFGLPMDVNALIKMFFKETGVVVDRSDRILYR